MFGEQGPLSKWINDAIEAVANAQDTPGVLNAATKRLKQLFVEVDPEITRLQELQKEIADEIASLKSLKERQEQREQLES